MSRRLMVLGALALIAVVAAIVGVSRSSSPLAEARGLVDRPANFATGLEAGDTLARVSRLLLVEADGCDDAEDGCQALHAGAAFAQVLAGRVLVCTAPGRADARAKMARVLDTVSSGGLLELPELPVCG